MKSQLQLLSEVTDLDEEAQDTTTARKRQDSVVSEMVMNYFTAQ